MAEIKLDKAGAKALYMALGDANDAVIRNGEKRRAEAKKKAVKKSK